MGLMSVSIAAESKTLPHMTTLYAVDDVRHMSAGEMPCLIET